MSLSPAHVLALAGTIRDPWLLRELARVVETDGVHENTEPELGPWGARPRDHAEATGTNALLAAADEINARVRALQRRRASAGRRTA